MSTPLTPNWAHANWKPFGRKIAPLALPYMIQSAREGRPISYGDPAAKIEARWRLTVQLCRRDNDA